MAKLNFPSFGDLVAFSNTFAPGGTFTGRQPSYAFDNTGDEVIYQRSQTLASTGYFNINPRVTLTGNDLSTNNRGELSGEITQLVFHQKTAALSPASRTFRSMVVTSPISFLTG